MEKVKSHLPVELVQEQLYSEAFAASSFHQLVGICPASCSQTGLTGRPAGGLYTSSRCGHVGVASFPARPVPRTDTKPTRHEGEPQDALGRTAAQSRNATKRRGESCADRDPAFRSPCGQTSRRASVPSPPGRAAPTRPRLPSAPSPTPQSAASPGPAPSPLRLRSSCATPGRGGKRRSPPADSPATPLRVRGAAACRQQPSARRWLRAAQPGRVARAALLSAAAAAGVAGPPCASCARRCGPGLAALHCVLIESIFIVGFAISENSFLLQPKYSNISCFWERQPLGCVRISCAFHHSKPRYINGLFLPPSNNAPLQQGVQDGMLHSAYHQESLRNQKNILLPIHPPLIINLNDEEDEEDDEEEENYVSTWVPRTAADIEEERAIKEMCYKSGEYYRIQYADEHQLTELMSSPPENELLPLEATQQDLKKGDGNKIPTKINNTKREEGRSRIRVPTESIPRTDCRSSENGGIHTSDPKGKPRHQQRGQSKDDETSSLPYVRETGRKTYFNSSTPRRSAYVVYRTVTVTQEPKFSGSAGEYPSGYYNAPTRRTRNPDAKTLSKFKTTIQSQEDMEVNRKGEQYIER
ncbi:uncharacterized protein [Numenius arquata]|uniref:uncharacterized protein n=1 Tax=Numenius arquata TaxID=31919 RepID=UPI003D309FA0